MKASFRRITSWSSGLAGLAMMSGCDGDDAGEVIGIILASGQVVVSILEVVGVFF